MTTQELYNAYVKKEVNVQEFLYEIRKNPILKQYISPVNTAEDVIVILKQRGVIAEQVSEDYPAVDPSDEKEMRQSSQSFGNKTKDAEFYIVSSKSGKTLATAETGSEASEKIKDLAKENPGDQFLKVPKHIYKNKKLMEQLLQEYNKRADESLNEVRRGKGMTADDVNPYEFRKGWKHELEHTDDIDKAKKIAIDHLAEDPNYYTHLDAMEAEVNKNLKKAKMKEVPKDSKEVKDKDNAMKEPKGQKKEKSNVKSSLGRKEKGKAHPKGVKLMKEAEEPKDHAIFVRGDKYQTVPSLRMITKTQYDAAKLGPVIVQKLKPEEVRKYLEKNKEISAQEPEKKPNTQTTVSTSKVDSPKKNDGKKKEKEIPKKPFEKTFGVIVKSGPGAPSDIKQYSLKQIKNWVDKYGEDSVELKYPVKMDDYLKFSDEFGKNVKILTKLNVFLPDKTKTQTTFSPTARPKEIEKKSSTISPAKDEPKTDSLGIKQATVNPSSYRGKYLVIINKKDGEMVSANKEDNKIFGVYNDKKEADQYAKNTNGLVIQGIAVNKFVVTESKSLFESLKEIKDHIKSIIRGILSEEMKLHNDSKGKGVQVTDQRDNVLFSKNDVVKTKDGKESKIEEFAKEGDGIKAKLEGGEKHDIKDLTRVTKAVDKFKSVQSPIKENDTAELAVDAVLKSIENKAIGKSEVKKVIDVIKDEFPEGITVDELEIAMEKYDMKQDSILRLIVGLAKAGLLLGTSGVKLDPKQAFDQYTGMKADPSKFSVNEEQTLSWISSEKAQKLLDLSKYNLEDNFDSPSKMAVAELIDRYLNSKIKIIPIEEFDKIKNPSIIGYKRDGNGEKLFILTKGPSIKWKLLTFDQFNINEQRLSGVKVEKGKMHKVLGLKPEENIASKYKSGEALYNALMKKVKDEKKVVGMLAFAANISKKKDVFDAALHHAKKVKPQEKKK